MARQQTERNTITTVLYDKVQTKEQTIAGLENTLNVAEHNIQQLQLQLQAQIEQSDAEEDLKSETIKRLESDVAALTDQLDQKDEKIVLLTLSTHDLESAQQEQEVIENKRVEVQKAKDIQKDLLISQLQGKLAQSTIANELQDEHIKTLSQQIQDAQDNTQTIQDQVATARREIDSALNNPSAPLLTLTNAQQVLPDAAITFKSGNQLSQLLIEDLDSDTPSPEDDSPLSTNNLNHMLPPTPIIETSHMAVSPDGLLSRLVPVNEVEVGLSGSITNNADEAI